MGVIKRVLEIRKISNSGYSAEACVTDALSRRFAELTSDDNPLVEKGVISGFYLDSLVASAFDTSMAGTRRPTSIVSMCSKFREFFRAGAPAAFSFFPGDATSAEVSITSAEGKEKQLCSVSINYGEPLQSRADLKSLGGMQGAMEYSFSGSELQDFCRMTGGMAGGKYLAPMLALSYFSGASAMVVSSGCTAEKPAVRFGKAGPFFIWGQGFSDNGESAEGPEAQASLEKLSHHARDCFDRGGVVYTSHSVTFFRGAYELVPSERFMIYVDYSGLRAVMSKNGSLAGIKGTVKGQALLENGERLFECSAGVLSRRAG